MKRTKDGNIPTICPNCNSQVVRIPQKIMGNYEYIYFFCLNTSNEDCEYSGFRRIRKIRCSQCERVYELSELYCNKSGRGANGLCEGHDFSDLYCENCLIIMGMDKLREGSKGR